jgi:zinc D-Ala-D-Ala carboxypeptidase
MNWPHFTQKELACRHCGDHKINFNFMNQLESLRIEYEHPMMLTSAYRCPEHNAKISSTGIGGPHTTGKAVDIQVCGESAYKLIRLAIKHGFTGIGLCQKGPYEERFVHLDTLTKEDGAPRPRIWTY